MGGVTHRHLLKIGSGAYGDYFYNQRDLEFLVCYEIVIPHLDVRVMPEVTSDWSFGLSWTPIGYET